MSWLLKGQTIAPSEILGLQNLICILNFDSKTEKYQPMLFGFDKEVRHKKTWFQPFMYILLIVKLQ
jgi:hypothetical protein